MNIVNSVNLKTDRQVGVVIPTAMRHDFTPFLHKLDRSLIQHGMKPIFFIQAAPLADVEKGLSVIRSHFPQAEISIGPAPPGQRIQNGLSAASSKTDVMFYICDDFDHLLPKVRGAPDGYVPGFAKQIGEGNDVLLANWDRLSVHHLPYPMWLNEAGISAAVTYARADHPATLKPAICAPFVDILMFDAGMLDNFISQSKKLGTWTQVYIGIEGMVSCKWDGILANMHSLFDDAATIPYLYGTGTEAGLPLAAIDLNLKIGSYTVHKRFEHSIKLEDGSYSAKKFAQSRQSQFDDGTPVTLQYVDKLSERIESRYPNITDLNHLQPDSEEWKIKKTALDLSDKYACLFAFSLEMSAAISSAPFHWPGHEEWPKTSRWNTEIRTGF